MRSFSRKRHECRARIYPQMSRATFFEKHRPKMVVALLLTFASGLADIVGYLGIFHLFTAHLTGTTVHLGRMAANREWKDAAPAVAVLAAFFVGSIFGRAVIQVGSRKRIRKIASITLAVEGALLVLVAERGAIFTLAPRWPIALLAAAMGIQTATLTGIGPLTVHTTFVTGMVNKTAQLVSRIMFRAYDLRRSKSPNAEGRREQKDEIEMTSFLFGVWLCYIAGAAAGTWSFALLGLRALFIVVALLATALITDQFRPLSVLEEIEQSES